MIEVLETKNKFIAVVDRDDLVKHIENELSEKIISSITSRYDGIYMDRQARLFQMIENEVVNKMVDKLMKEHSQNILLKIDVSAVANMVAMSAGRDFNKK